MTDENENNNYGSPNDNIIVVMSYSVRCLTARSKTFLVLLGQEVLESVLGPQ